MGSLCFLVFTFSLNASKVTEKAIPNITNASIKYVNMVTQIVNCGRLEAVDDGAAVVVTLLSDDIFCFFQIQSICLNKKRR